MARVLASACLIAFLTVASTASAAPATHRKPAPAIVGKTLTGKKVSLAAMRGKPVFINVWSSW